MTDVTITKEKTDARHGRYVARIAGIDAEAELTFTRRTPDRCVRMSPPAMPGIPIGRMRSRPQQGNAPRVKTREGHGLRGHTRDATDRLRSGRRIIPRPVQTNRNHVPQGSATALPARPESRITTSAKPVIPASRDPAPWLFQVFPARWW